MASNRRTLSHGMKTPLDKIFASARDRLGLTNEQLHAKLAAYPWPAGTKAPAVATVGHWCNGTRRPRNMQHLAAMCSVLDLSLDEILLDANDEAQTAYEQAVLRGLRDLDQAQQEYVLATIGMLKRAKQ